MNPTDVLAQSQDVARGVLAHVTTDQLELDTPCREWTVAQLIDHLVGGQHWARCGVQGAEMSETGEGSAQGDFAATFDQAARDNLAAFSEEGALGRTVNPGFGDMPAPALMGLSATDTFTHAWDLARATGQETDLAPDLAAMLLEQSRQAIQPAFRSEEGTIFGMEQPAPDGASAADQLAAFLGRTV
jgi:uncharacterized protein (TIGR03086 family)